jgi:hypothetical protein
MALGELGACVLLAGEREVSADALTLRLHDELLQGAAAPPALAR